MYTKNKINNLDEQINVNENIIIQKQMLNKIYFSEDKIPNYDFFKESVFNKYPIILLNNGDLKYYSWEENRYILFQNDQEIYNLLYSIFEFSVQNIKSLNEIIRKGLKTHALTFKVKHVKELDINEIAFKDCIFNISTLEAKPISPDYYIINQIPLNFKDVVELSEEELDTPIFDQYLSDWLTISDDEERSKEQISCFKEMIGFCLVRKYDFESMFILEGKGRNGKSTAIEIIQDIFSKNNYTNISLQNLSEDKNYCVANLYEKLINFSGDLNNTLIKQTGLIKQLTGGDPVNARRIYKDSFDFTNYAKFIFATNELPSTSDLTDGYIRRHVILSFPNVFEENMKFKHNLLLKCKPEYAKFLMKCILAYKNNTLVNKRFTGEKTTEEKKKQYHDLANPIDYYINEELEILPDETFSNEYNPNYCIHKKVLDEKINDYLKAINKPYKIEKKGYSKFLKKYIDNTRILVDKNFPTEDGKTTSRTYYAGMRFKNCINPISEIKIYDIKSNKFKEIKEYRDIEFGKEYKWEEIVATFKHYTEEDLKQIITSWKKQGAVTEVRSGIFRFENINKKEMEL
jgi:P4 family phage/plasmid primase-like protien